MEFQKPSGNSIQEDIIIITTYMTPALDEQTKYQHKIQNIAIELTFRKCIILAGLSYKEVDFVYKKMLFFANERKWYLLL